MWARARLHIGWSDLAYGLWSCLHSAPRANLTRRTEAYWSYQDDTLACFSVRSGFDLLLQALTFPQDSEILFSALNVKGMIKIARRHGLVPVPVDLDIPHMGPSLEALERAITPKTRAIVVAHLFGTRLDLDGVVDLAKRHNLLILEDCAQAFDGHLYAGHPDSDVAMFSFGPLKTATALGGALLRIKDPALLARMRQIQAAYPKQSRGAFLVRVLKFAGLKVVTSRPVFALIHRFFRAGGKDYEDSISNSVRGVATLGSNKQLRFQPSDAMLALLDRRLGLWRDGSLETRAGTGEELHRLLGDRVVQPAIANPIHTYWVFPILVDEPRKMIRKLRDAGFDGANLPRSEAVAAPDNRPELAPEIARDALAKLLILPCYPGMPHAELEREANLVLEILEDDRQKQASDEPSSPTTNTAPSQPMPTAQEAGRIPSRTAG